METSDMGNTWKNAGGEVIQIPIKDSVNPALVYDSRVDNLLVYLKEVAFERDGNPVILFLTSKGYESGPKSDPRTWRTARWTGKEWQIRDVTVSDHNYDFGALWIDDDGAWRIIGPTEPGPSPYTTGGDMVLWTSHDQGATWTRAKQLTKATKRNHTYARKPVNVHPDFYAFWADGETLQPSVSYLYFTDKEGSGVWRLPPKMTTEFAKPELVPLP